MKRITFFAILIVFFRVFANAQTNDEIKKIYELNSSFTQDRFFYSLSSEKQIILFASKTWDITIWVNGKKLKGNQIYYKEHGLWSFESEQKYYFEFQYIDNSVDISSLNELPFGKNYNTTLSEIGIPANKDSIINIWINKNDIIHLSLSNAVILNDKAYFLTEIGCFNEAIMILKIVLDYYPSRIVAYINLGDAYWGLKEHIKAKEAYQKYIELMKASGKEAKIPQRVWDRRK